MDSASGCRPNGDAKFSVVDEGRDVRASPLSSRRSTPEPDSSSRDDRRFTRRQRLTRGSELRSAMRDGKRIRTPALDVRLAITRGETARVGVIVPKHGQSAVQRNRLKRRLRELARLRILGAVRDRAPGSGMDIVMRALPSAYRASFEELRGQVEAVLARLARWLDTFRDAANPSAVTERPARS
jgi:ribonuclease P protein component